ncbi:acyltransferase domain protein [Treponema primitia ZAS-2]|uniref:Acyltransferase domain protein n=1 Tax=Treponema primitia (strain ATCC BAA-887 / DSM 12427 / ZAS-2) TaxID=545694 RepID=F5YJH5_TREPZ|nr:lysophospholipid acyltransferase family protein [Treponema primitia]AEF85049.1 acyltransferase domain protein [Treponema primitia ZAS-2]
MRYQRGRPLLNTSLPFRIASVLVFSIIWPLVQFVNSMLYSTAWKNRVKLFRLKRAILVSNHTTPLDPLMVSGMILPYLTWHTLLEATVEAPVVGTFTRLLGGMPLPPGARGLKQILETCDTAFRYRKFIHFYPEGECYLYNQQIKEFKPGAFLIAAEMDLPVVPLVTVMSEGLFKAPSFWSRKRPKETLVTLDPVYPSQYIRRNEAGEIENASVREFAEAVRKIMQGEITRRGGSSAFYRGRMERVKGINA